MRFNSAKAIAGLALFAGGMAASIAAQTLKGDPGKAVAIVEKSCSACHGQDGHSPVPNFPNLAGHRPEYLLHELQEYRNHHRESEMMGPLAQDLSEADMINLSVYFAGQKPQPVPGTEPGLMALGKQIYLDGLPDKGVPACAGCHEEDGAGTSRFPRVAGQHVEYIVDQFNQYATGKRKFGKKVMRTVAERMTEQEVRAVAEYVATMP
jgi:cytochrome c553